MPRCVDRLLRLHIIAFNTEACLTRWMGEELSRSDRIRINANLQLLHLTNAFDNTFSVLEGGLASSIKSIEEVSANTDDDFHDAVFEDECDSIEQFLGFVFVAAQRVITATRTRFTHLSDMYRSVAGKSFSFVTSDDPYSIYKFSNPIRNEAKYTEIEVINAIANYWKHQEEWPTRFVTKDAWAELEWDQESMQNGPKNTAQIVLSIGLSPSSTGNLRTAISAFSDNSSCENIAPIKDILHNWVNYLHKMAQYEVSALARTNNE